MCVYCGVSRNCARTFPQSSRRGGGGGGGPAGGGEERRCTVQRKKTTWRRCGHVSPGPNGGHPPSAVRRLGCAADARRRYGGVGRLGGRGVRLQRRGHCADRDGDEPLTPGEPC